MVLESSPATSPSETLRTLAASADQSVQQPAHKNETGGLGDWFYENMGKPAINAAIIDPINIVGDNIQHHVQQLEYEPGQFGSKEWIAQTVGSVAGVVPYVIVGRLVGCGSRLAAESIGAESSMLGRTFGRFAASESLTQIAGAGIYDYSRTPKKNETRETNALSGVVSFGLFEFGNAKLAKLPFGEALSKRFGVGMLGSGAGYLSSRLLGPEHSVNFEDGLKASLTGGLINAGLPAVQYGFAKGADVIDGLIGRGIPQSRHVESKGWTDKTVIQDLANNPYARLTRVGGHSDQPYLEGNQIHPNTKADDLTQQSDFAHELQHKIARAQLESRYREAASLIGDHNSGRDPREAYINIQRADEAMAQEAGARAAGQTLDASAKVGADGIAPKQDAQHEAQYAEDADKFVASGGTYRPEISFMGGGGHGGGGGGGGGGGRGGGGGGRGAGRNTDSITYADTIKPIVGDGFSLDPKTGIMSVFTKDGLPEPTKLDGTGEVIDGVQYDYLAKKGESGKAYERILRPGAQKVNDVFWGSVEFHKNGVETAYGLADRVEHMLDGVSIKYHILKGNALGVTDGSNFEVYPKGLETKDHGMILYKETKSDGMMEYKTAAGEMVSEYPENLKPNWGWCTVDSATVRSDNTTNYKTSAGSLETLPPNQPMTLKVGNEEFAVKNILRMDNGETRYQTVDGQNIIVTAARDAVLVTKSAGNGQPVAMLDITTPVTEVYPKETYPNGHVIRDEGHSAIITKVEVHPGFTRKFSNSYVEDEFVTPPADPSGTGSVLYTQHIKGKSVNILDNGGTHEFWLKDRNSLEDPLVPLPVEYVRGLSTGFVRGQDGSVVYDLVGHGAPQPGGKPIVDSYTVRLSTTLDNELQGAVKEVERTPQRYIYRTNENEVLVVPLGTGERTMLHTFDETGKPTGVKQLTATDIVENYAQKPVETPFGTATALRVSTDGSLLYSIVKDPSNPNIPEPGYNTVQVFITPRQTTYGPLNFAKRMNDGTYSLMFSDGRTANAVAEQTYRALISGG